MLCARKNLKKYQNLWNKNKQLHEGKIAADGCIHKKGCRKQGICNSYSKSCSLCDVLRHWRKTILSQRNKFDDLEQVTKPKPKIGSDERNLVKPFYLGTGKKDFDVGDDDRVIRLYESLLPMQKKQLLKKC